MFDKEVNMRRIHQYSFGILAILIAAVLFGVAGALAKVLFHAEISPIDLTAVRSLVACAVFSLAMLERSPIRLHMQPQQTPRRRRLCPRGALFNLIGNRSSRTYGILYSPSRMSHSTVSETL